MRRWLRLAAATVGALAIVAVLTFPTDRLVRWAVSRVTPPSGPFLVFRRAVLRPWGLRFDEPALRRPDGSALVVLDWLRVRPSLRGFLRDRTGRPWHVVLGACGGTVEGDIDAEGGAPRVVATWTDVDLAHCPPLAIKGGALAGHTTGTATVRVPTGGQPSGAGELTFRNAAWQVDQPSTPGLDALHADRATLKWNLHEGRLTLEHLDLRGPELEVRGTGTARLTGNMRRSPLDLDLTVAPGPDLPEVLAPYLERLPPATDAPPPARSLVVRGTIDAPRVMTR